MRFDAGSSAAAYSSDSTIRLRGDVPGNGGRSVRDGKPWMEGFIPTAKHQNETGGILSDRRGDPSRPRRTDGGPVGQGRSERDIQGLRFDIKVDDGGYAWWYIDAISDDGVYGITIIAFIGSVFSPYYAWSKARNPFDHCALNVALYGPGIGRWAMTERPKNNVSISANEFQLADSAMTWDGSKLRIKIDEHLSPIPSPVRGEVIVDTSFQNNQSFQIDEKGRHRWRPICTAARVSARFTDPDLSWSGNGYLDTNDGDEPLEDGFRFWDWSRAELPNGESAVLYNCDLWNGGQQSIAIRLDKSGNIEQAEQPSAVPLPPTPIWRIKRRTGADHGTQPKLIKTLEDTPFYSRSIIESTIWGETCRSMHESFSGARYQSPIIKSMLKFRMPRRSR